MKKTAAKKPRSLDEELDDLDKELADTDQFLAQQSVREQDVAQTKARLKKL